MLYHLFDKNKTFLKKKNPLVSNGNVSDVNDNSIFLMFFDFFIHCIYFYIKSHLTDNDINTATTTKVQTTLFKIFISIIKHLDVLPHVGR